MAFSTYAELQTEIAEYLNRADLTARIPGFIKLAEAEIQRDLRLPEMLSRQLATIDTDSFTLPTNFREAVTMLNVGRSELEYRTNSEVAEMRASPIQMTGDPRFFTLYGKTAQILPGPTSEIQIELIYRAEVPALSDSNQTNWLLTKAPDLYLFGSLLRAEMFLDNDERIPLWRSEFDRVKGSLQIEGDRADKPQGRLQMKRRTFG